MFLCIFFEKLFRLPKKLIYLFLPKAAEKESKLWEIQKGGDSKQKEIPAENKLQN